MADITSPTSTLGVPAAPPAPATTVAPSTSPNLTPTLSDVQLKQNIDALQKGGMQNADIQTYVNNYQKNGDGSYALKSSGAPQPSTTTQQPEVGPVKGAFNAVGGAAKTVGSFLTSSEQGVGQSIAAGAIPNLSDFKGAQTSESQAEAYGPRILQAIRANQAAGKDTTKLQAAYKIATGGNLATQYTDLNPASTKTNAQALGEVGGVGLDILSAGSYGAEARAAENTGKLVTGSAKIASLAGDAGLDVVKQTAKTGAENVAKNTLKTVATKSAEGAGQGYGYDVSQNFQNGKTGASAFTPGLGTAIGAATPFATALVGSMAKGLAGKLSGTGTDVIDRAMQNPDSVGQAVNKYATTPEAKSELVSQASDALNSYAKQKSDEYGQKLSALVADKPISKSIVTNTFVDAVDKFGGKIDEKGNLTFGDSALTSADKTNITNAWNDIKGWQDVTPQGMDTLRQNIGNNMTDFKASGNPRANVVLGQVKTALTNAMKDSIPGYSDMLTNYGDKADAAKEFAKQFSLSGTAQDSTKLNKVLGIFKKDPAAMANLEKVMGKDGASKFQNEVSGAILSNWVNPSKVGNTAEALGVGGLVVAHNPVGAATIAAASSPRIVGKTATTFGKAINAGAGIAGRRILPKVAAQAQQTVFGH